MNQNMPQIPFVFQRLDLCAAYPYRKREYFLRTLWWIVQATLFRFSSPRAYAWRRWLLRLFGAKMAPFARVRNTTRIFHPWLLQMDEQALVGDSVIIYNLGPVRIGSHSMVSQYTYLCAGTHDHTRPDLPLLRLPITVGNGVWIAAEAFIGPNVTVGDNSVIGARSVVTKDVPPGMIVAGNPARVIRPRPMREIPSEAAAKTK